MLLLEGVFEDIVWFVLDMELVDVLCLVVWVYCCSKVFIVIICLLLVVMLVVLDVVLIQVLVFIVVVVILIMCCVDVEEVFLFVDGCLLVMIFVMLVVGEVLEYIGMVNLIVDFVLFYLQGMLFFFMLIVIYFLGLIMIEVLLNNVVVVLLIFIVIVLVKLLGYDLCVYVVVVMFLVIVVFVMFIGYQMYMMVYGLGGYKFLDFVWVGVLLDIICGIVVCLMILLFWLL